MFEGAKKEYDQAIDRNAALGDLANQKSSGQGKRPFPTIMKVIIFGAITIAIALLIIL
jgi:hypothetical protein